MEYHAAAGCVLFEFLFDSHFSVEVQAYRDCIYLRTVGQGYILHLQKNEWTPFAFVSLVDMLEEAAAAVDWLGFQHRFSGYKVGAGLSVADE